MKKQKEQLPENPKFHDTWLLLRKYRDVVWGLELSVQQVKRRFQMEFGSSIEDFLESIYIAGVDFSDNGIQTQLQSETHGCRTESITKNLETTSYCHHCNSLYNRLYNSFIFRGESQFGFLPLLTGKQKTAGMSRAAKPFI